ncbi:hypothetical protein C0Q70_15716 [Pomacea canaliculata]|uniref:Pre-mRNA-splicing factor 18 n=1 Tax=Pomacea canaliculata TaxID=400727 RepID=A0A2T7NVL5_POMCA|nr:pre-mRNA-splicing factor 18-like [Pomacea canaliculata]PVD25218.1 hypothetical protein C0Q70_15716 [Pomacea canaliculata]
MDYLTEMKAEIEKRKRQLEDNDVMVPGKKYFKRGVLSAKEREEYIRKHYQVESPNKPQESQTMGKDQPEKSKPLEEEKVSQLPRKEVIRKLRDRGEPITLFGETHYESYLRLKRLESLVPDFKNMGVGDNDFKAAMDAVDQQYLNDIISSSDRPSEATSTDVSVKDDGTREKDIQTMRAEIGTGDGNKDQDIILRFFKFLMKEWGERLNSRPLEEKRTTRGKMASATHSQTVSYLKPLFRQLKQKKVEEGLLESFVIIVQNMMDRDYIKANDAYLEMAIGNAPWPIGVTMVGIHARTGREKISSRYVAHVLNDETQRKYIQAIKRLITQCQKIFPTDPSRSFNYQCPV